LLPRNVEKAAKETSYDFSGVDKPQNEHSPYGLRYSEFVVPLVKAVQELSKQNDDLRDENKELESRLNKIEAMIFTNSKQTSETSNQQKINVQQIPKLEQNHPNPSTQTTVIKYFLPEQSTKAIMRITSAAGQEIRSINLSAKGSGQITLQTNNLSAGSYFYSLIVDGQNCRHQKDGDHSLSCRCQ
jgi:hypothetical protein